MHISQVECIFFYFKASKISGILLFERRKYPFKFSKCKLKMAVTNFNFACYSSHKYKHHQPLLLIVEHIQVFFWVFYILYSKSSTSPNLCKYFPGAYGTDDVERPQGAGNCFLNELLKHMGRIHTGVLGKHKDEEVQSKC